MVDGAVSSNPLIVLTRKLFGTCKYYNFMFGITHLKLMIHIQRNQLVDLHKQKLEAVAELNLSKNANTFLKISFLSGVILTFLL